MAEAVGFEPTNELPRYRISSAGRYDHFDTLPYSLTISIRKWAFKARCAYYLDHFDTLPYQMFISVIYYSI